VGEVVGGILDHAGVDGFLGNLEELRNAGQDTSQTDFLRAVHARHRSEPFMARSVIDLGVEYFHIGEGTDAELANRVGYRLRELVDRPRGGLVLRRGTSTHPGGRNWAVEQVRALARNHALSPASPASGAPDFESAENTGHAGHETNPDTCGAAWDRLERKRAEARR
jgi:hypothetical protein